MLLLPRNSTQYIISGTKYYRLASRKINCLGDRGTNLQNIEKSARKLYWADEGKILNQRDQSGAEALIVAYLCRHGLFRDLFINGIKPHVFVALHLFEREWQQIINDQKLDIRCDISELCSTSISNLKTNPFWKAVDKLIKSSDEWPPSRRFYYIAKQVCHSSNYGIKANAFCMNTLDKSGGKIALKVDDANRFLSMYHGLFPEIREWHAQVEQQVRETRILWNLLGDPIQFTGSLMTDNDIKEALSSIPQSTVACITRQAYVQMQEYIEVTGFRWDLLQDNHDSFVVQSLIEESELCHRIMKPLIEPELDNGRGEKFNMRSEGQTGYNWSSYHPVKNPRGLKEVNI